MKCAESSSEWQKLFIYVFFPKEKILFQPVVLVTAELVGTRPVARKIKSNFLNYV